MQKKQTKKKKNSSLMLLMDNADLRYVMCWMVNISKWIKSSFAGAQVMVSFLRPFFNVIQ